MVGNKIDAILNRMKMKEVGLEVGLEVVVELKMKLDRYFFYVTL